MLFLAGFADSIAGGGGTISVPSALLAGIPIHTAYGTNKLAMSLGTLTSVIQYGRSGNICWYTALFAAAGAAQPVTGIVDQLSGDNQIFYGIYDDGAKAALGSFASYKSVAGLGTVREVFFDPVNSLVSGSMTEQEWIDSIKAASDQMRANIQ